LLPNLKFYLLFVACLPSAVLASTDTSDCARSSFSSLISSPQAALQGRSTPGGGHTPIVDAREPTPFDTEAQPSQSESNMEWQSQSLLNERSIADTGSHSVDVAVPEVRFPPERGDVVCTQTFDFPGVLDAATDEGVCLLFVIFLS
jgi:hypothetical protein